MGRPRSSTRILDTSQAKEFAVAHWLTVGASGGRLFVRVFDGAGNVRADIAGDVLASITTMQWNGPAKGWNAGAPMDDANFNRRQTIRVGPSVSYAQVRVIGFDGPIDLQSLRLYGLPEAAPAVLNGTPLLPQSGQQEFAAEVSWDSPSLAPTARPPMAPTAPPASWRSSAFSALAPRPCCACRAVARCWWKAPPRWRISSLAEAPPRAGPVPT